MESDNSIKVAIRIRPQVSKEIIDMCNVCTDVTPNEPQVLLGKDKGFTFDHVYDMVSRQETIYESSVSQLVEGCFEGYNATVLAYGQTGSGKTYTMGTGLEIGGNSVDKGIIPRAIEHLFNGIRLRQKEARERGIPVPEFKLNAQFLELYNEDVIDLLADERTKHSQIKIREDAEGGMYLTGAITKPVGSVEDAMVCLKTGALSRTTASTQMNAQSSRSHAIFTLHVKQQRIVAVDLTSSDKEEGESEDVEEGEAEKHVNGDAILAQEFETLTAKFHFVDLAGSERLKRTGATGERAKEGISINSGLLALGNVISALGDKSKRALHVPYRDSKLTRLLQDSLGGNSRTMMIACISPSDRDFMETLNTLRYANRAKNIKNRVVANQDKSSQTIGVLRRQIQQLQLELMEYQQGKRLIGEDGCEQVNDMYHENTMFQTEINNLKTRIKALQETNTRLIQRNADLLSEKETGAWITSDNSKSEIGDMVHKYMVEIEELRTKLIEAEETCSHLRRQVQRNYAQRLSMSPYSTTAVAISGHYDIGMETETSSVNEVLEEAKRDVARSKKLTKTMSNKSTREGDAQDTNGNEVSEENGSVNGDDADGESPEGSSNEDSDEEQKEENNQMEFALVELSNEITVKEKLILELEKSKRKMDTMKQQYEDKLVQLQVKINAIETERDQVLAKLSGAGSVANNEKSKKVREDYERKLNSLQSEMKKLQVAKKEHVQVMRNQAQYENKLRLLKNEVGEMKKQKVRLLTQMKEETQRHRETDLRNTKRIAQLSKQDRLKEVKIRSLEGEKNRFKAMLNRKDQEVVALKKRVKPMSDRVAGKVPMSSRAHAVRPVLHPFSPKVAKQKWQRLEQNISKLILSKQTILSHEQQMERFLHQREQLSHCMDKVAKKCESAVREGRDERVIRELRDDIGLYEANINYVNASINECQSAIIQLEDAKEDSEMVDMNDFLNSAQSDEVKYLFEKVLAMAISQGLAASQKEEEKREYELKYKQVIDSSLIQEQLLHHVLETTFIQEQDYAPDDFNGLENEMTRSQLLLCERPMLPPSAPASHFPNAEMTKTEKARRMTKTPEELLFETSSCNLIKNPYDSREDPMTKSLWSPASMASAVSGHELHRVPSAPSLKDNQTKSSKIEAASPSFQRKMFERTHLLDARRLNKTTNNLSASGGIPTNQPQSYVTRQLSMELTDTTPPASPPVLRRNREDNVFSRLTSGTAANIQSNPDRGVIAPFTGKAQYDKNSSLICTHVAEGHSRAVLSVSATNDVLFSGSKDCTVKIWDLHTGQEIQSLTEHPDAVAVVRYNEYNRLAFSVSKSYIKVWDPRDNPARCIKTLNSSGLVSQNGPATGSMLKGTELAAGETRIFDIQLSPYGTTLFSTCSNIVRFWDLRMFYCVGKLNTGHQAGIICMAVEEAGVDNNIVITGSKDHYIKVFEVQEGIGGIHNPRMTLRPPHYDGIEALRMHGDHLFSASRDACIKKWDLSSQRLVQSLNSAHKDWIQSLAIAPNSNTLISGCRTGFLKLWSTDSCQLMGQIKAHPAAINSIDTNASLVFTASADNTVALWRWRSSSDPSPESSEFPE